MDIKPQYIVNEKNHKIAVQLDIETYHKIEEVLENYALYHLMQTEDQKDDEPLNAEEAKSYYDQLKKKHEN